MACAAVPEHRKLRQEDLGGVPGCPELPGRNVTPAGGGGRACPDCREGPAIRSLLRGRPDVQGMLSLTPLLHLECEAAWNRGRHIVGEHLLVLVLLAFHTCLLKHQQQSGHRQEGRGEQSCHLGSHSLDQDRPMVRSTDWLKLSLDVQSCRGCRDGPFNRTGTVIKIEGQFHFPHAPISQRK